MVVSVVGAVAAGDALEDSVDHPVGVPIVVHHVDGTGGVHEGDAGDVDDVRHLASGHLDDLTVAEIVVDLDPGRGRAGDGEVVDRVVAFGAVALDGFTGLEVHQVDAGAGLDEAVAAGLERIGAVVVAGAVVGVVAGVGHAGIVRVAVAVVGVVGVRAAEAEQGGDHEDRAGHGALR